VSEITCLYLPRTVMCRLVRSNDPTHTEVKRLYLIFGRLWALRRQARLGFPRLYMSPYSFLVHRQDESRCLRYSLLLVSSFPRLSLLILPILPPPRVIRHPWNAFTLFFPSLELRFSIVNNDTLPSHLTQNCNSAGYPRSSLRATMGKIRNGTFCAFMAKKYYQ